MPVSRSDITNGILPPWIWKDNPPSRIIEKSIWGLIIILSIYFFSEFLSYPDFHLISNATSCNFTPDYDMSYDRWNAYPNLSMRNISVEARNIHSIKKYKYPIFLWGEFIATNSWNSTYDLKEISVAIEPREIFVGEKSTLSIKLNNYSVPKGDYNLRVYGRGGGGESITLGEGPLSLLSIHTSGQEPSHFCTITICILDPMHKEKPEPDPKTKSSDFKYNFTVPQRQPESFTSLKW